MSVKSQNRILVDINNEISNIEDKEGLLYLISKTLKKYINFDESFILFYNKEKKGETFICHLETSHSLTKEFLDYLEIASSFEDEKLKDEPLKVQYVDVPFKQKRKDAFFVHKTGIKEFVNVKLYHKDNFIGYFVLLSEKNGSFTPENLKFITNISYQIGIATAKIIAIEDTYKREEEKNMLFDLTNEIASIRNRGDLIQVFTKKLKNIFSFKEFALVKTSENDKKYSKFILEVGESTRNHDSFENIINQEYNTSDPLYSRVIQTDSPISFDVRELMAIPNMPVYVEFWHSIGIKTIVAIALNASGKNIGCAFFNVEPAQINNINKNLLKGLCAQLSITMSNILANEEIEKREVEKTILLSLSSALSVLKNRNDLLEIVNSRIKRLFLIEELSIAKIDETGKTYSAFMMDLKENITNDVDFHDTTSITYDVSDPLFRRTMQSKDPILFHVDQIVNIPEMPGFVHFWKKMGLKQVICTAMRAGGKDIGMLVLHIDPNKKLDPTSGLLKGVCAQLSVAISNIMASEEIRERERERELLLSLNLDISEVRNNDELLTIISKRLKKILGFSHTVIALLNKDEKTVSAFLIDPKSKSKKHPIYKNITTKKFPLNDGILDRAYETNTVSTFNLKEIHELQELPLYLKVNYESGINAAAIIRFSKSDKVFGFWLLFYEKNIEPNKKWSSLIEGLANQISIALLNIIANEEIKKRENERNLLLMLNMDLAAVRTLEDFMFVITGKLKKIFHFSHSLLAKINEDGTTMSPLLYDPVSKSKNHPLYQNLAENKYIIEDGILDKALQTDQPTIVDLNKLLESNQELPFYAKINFEKGIKQIVITRFFNGDSVYGFWMIFFDSEIILDPNKSRLIKGISDQMSIAIANVFAIQEIKLREKEKSQLLEFSNLITSVKDRISLSKIIAQQFKEILNINEYAIHLLSEDKKTHGPIFFDPEAEFAYHHVFLAMIKQENDINDGMLNTILNSDEPITFDAQKWITLASPSANADAGLDTDLKELTGIRISLGTENIGILYFVQEGTYISSDKYPLLKSICSQIAIAISNITAHEKILKQLKEIKQYKKQLEEEKIYLQEEIITNQNFTEMIGESIEMRKVFRLVDQVASSDSTVLLLGETGTGKELIARAIHNSSPRQNKLMVKVNCAALPINLIESELFGHERGSFTGANERRIGKFELANNGTLFLDEIGEMPLELQVKLLRVLQEKEIERLGGRTTIKVNVRIIAATNRNLEKLMADGKFRIDLYYRLNIFPINLPPLRNRKEDIPALASHFIKRFSKKTGKQITNFSSKALEEMMQYDWPGNIRELEHLIERSVLLATGDTVKGILLPSKNSTSISKENEVLDIKTIDDNERDYILKILKYTNGRIAGIGGAAELLGIPPTTLHSRMKRLGIKKEHISNKRG